MNPLLREVPRFKGQGPNGFARPAPFSFWSFRHGELDIFAGSNSGSDCGSNCGSTVGLADGIGPLKSILLISVVAVCGVLSTRAADTKPLPGQPPSPAAAGPTAGSFDAFRAIADQNIFNPSRVGRSARATRTEATRPPEDVVRFVGTMDYEKGYFVFFDSSNPKFRGVFSQGGVIADFTVKKVTATSVELVHGEQTLSLQVAQQLTRADGGNWTVSATPPPLEAAAAAPDLASSVASAAAVIPADASDTVKRLMEQRQKQLKE